MRFACILMIALAAPTPGLAEQFLFSQPKVQAPIPGPTGGLGLTAPTRVDWCRIHTRQCGKPAAVAFCKVVGYQTAISWDRAENLQVTVSIGDKKLCNEGKCDGFSSIRCFR